LHNLLNKTNDTRHTNNHTLNKFILYILLLCGPLCAFAQIDEDTLADARAMYDGTVAIDTLAQPKTPAATYAAPVYGKRSFEPGFQKKYKDEDFVYKEQEAKKSLWQRFLEWIFGGSKKKSNVNLDWLGPILKVAAFAIIGFVVYLIVRLILNKQGMWIFGRSRVKIGTDAEDDIAANIHETDFKQLIEETKATGNYRLALRYYYLWVLKLLSYREIIGWDRDKTNSDYLYEIKDAGLRRDFEYLSYVYDHSWYGDFPIDERAFAKAERSFKKTLNTL